MVTTASSVIYKITMTDGQVLDIDNPTSLPPVTTIDKMEEPIVKATIMTSTDYVGSLMELAQERRDLLQRVKR